jgi:hypothetical protein
MISKRPFGGLGGLLERSCPRGPINTQPILLPVIRSSARVIRTRRGVARYKGSEKGESWNCG